MPAVLFYIRVSPIYIDRCGLFRSRDPLTLSTFELNYTAFFLGLADEELNFGVQNSQQIDN
jgi:hypothetical protein